MNAETNHGPGRGPLIDGETCDRMRRVYREGYSCPAIAAMDWVSIGKSSVAYHIKGDCAHDGDEPPVEMRDSVETVGIHPYECAAIRLLAHLDYHPHVLGLIGDFESVHNVRSHAHGDCECDVPVEPAPEYRRGVDRE